MPYLYDLFTDTRNHQVKETVSIIISSQVGNNRITNKITDSMLPRSNPIILEFDHNAVSYHITLYYIANEHTKVHSNRIDALLQDHIAYIDLNVVFYYVRIYSLIMCRI